MSDQVVYTSRIRVERIKGPHRRAYLPIEPKPIHFATHSEVAEHYGHDLEALPAHATTLDYLVAAIAG